MDETATPFGQWVRDRRRNYGFSSSACSRDMGKVESWWDAVEAGEYLPAEADVEANGRSYACTCKDGRHSTAREAWDGFARRLVVEFLRRMPEEDLRVPEHPAKPRPVAALSAARREMARAEEDVRGLVADAERQRRLLGDALYESVIVRARREWEAARDRVEALAREVGAPDARAGLLLLDALRQVDISAAPVDALRPVLRAMVARITLEDAPSGQWVRRARIEWQGWVVAAGLGFAIPRALWPPSRSNAG